MYQKLQTYKRSVGALSWGALGWRAVRRLAQLGPADLHVLVDGSHTRVRAARDLLLRHHRSTGAARPALCLWAARAARNRPAAPLVRDRSPRPRRWRRVQRSQHRSKLCRARVGLWLRAGGVRPAGHPQPGRVACRLRRRTPLRARTPADPTQVCYSHV